MRKISLIAILCLIGFSLNIYPLAIFHGLGDFCLNPAYNEFGKYINEKGGATDYHCFESGGSLLDFVTSFNHQAETACENLKKNDKFAGKEIAVMGLSQGALIARYIAEECEFGGKVKRFISIGGPQMGVAAFPHCASGIMCDIVNSVVDKFVYNSFIQGLIGPAGYFRNPKNFNSYLSGSTFLAKLNNEIQHDKTELYKQRILDIEKIVLVMFDQDTMIIPKETAHFQFFDESKHVVDFEKTDVYINDDLGLKQMKTEERIVFLTLPGDHLEFSESDLDNIAIPYLK